MADCDVCILSLVRGDMTASHDPRLAPIQIVIVKYGNLFERYESGLLC